MSWRSFFSHDPVCAACKVAIGRLSVAEREVIDGYFFQEEQVDVMAATRGVSESTIYNQKVRAQRRLEDDDVFFSALVSLRRVRDRARAQHLKSACPDGVLPDGRRLVVIDAA